MADVVRVLHIEDDKAFAEMTADFLAQVGDDISVTTETDPEDGIDHFRENPAGYDCIVSDYDMPSMNGLEVLRAFRREWPNVPFILFTGKGSEEIAAQAISAGVTDYLQKSAGSDTYEMLAHRIQNAVHSYRAQREAARVRQFLQKVVERATDMIAVVDTNHDIVFVSGSVERVLGYTPEEVKRMGPFELIHPDDRGQIEEHFRERLSDPDHPTGVRHRARHKDGHYVQITARAYNLTEDPDIGGVLIYSRESGEAVEH